jgi:hypothetical protein
MQPSRGVLLDNEGERPRITSRVARRRFSGAGEVTLGAVFL